MPKNKASKPITDPLLSINGPELVIGIVGPIGSNLSDLCKIITGELKKVDYDTHLIKISGLIREVPEYSHINESLEDKRIKALMAAGTELRNDTGRGDVLALMAVASIREFRQNKNNDNNPNSPVKRQAYILNSLKHPDEIRALREIYGRLFVLVSAYLPRENRVNNLAKVISKSRHGAGNAKQYRPIAEKLVNIDESEEGQDLGQDVSEAFPEADFFVSTDSTETMKKNINRFVEIFFGHPFHTPTQDEMGMYFAKSAALRSADLSRQVGAVISSSEGDVVSIGCNEVPKFGGGQYWPSDMDSDRRDFKIGYDSSAHSKSEIIQELISTISKLGIFKEGLTKNEGQEIISILLDGPGKKILKGTQIQNLLEFGRPVHAEMAAITNAARLGSSVHNTSLFCTTFPCHMCARHIISSGITRVVYIEPYPKSRVSELYNDSVVVDSPETVADKVSFQPFVGVAPRRYQEFFEKVTQRKDSSGNKVEWDPIKSNPRPRRLIVTYIYLEEQIIAFVSELLNKRSKNNTTSK